MGLLAITYGKNLDQNLTINLQNEHNKTINIISKNKTPKNTLLSRRILSKIENPKRTLIKKAITGSNKAKENIINLKQKGVIDTIKKQEILSKDIKESVINTLQSLRENHVINSFRLNNELAINKRIAKISNPYNENLILANAINKGDFSSINLMKEYDELISKKKNIYKKFIGGKMTTKDSKISPLIQGIILGCDSMFDNAILGIFASYTKSRVIHF